MERRSMYARVGSSVCERGMHFCVYVCSTESESACVDCVFVLLKLSLYVGIRQCMTYTIFICLSSEYSI